MRFYVTPAGRWAGTRDAAKELAREDHGWELCDVPTDKEGLLSFLNAHRVGVMHGDARAMIDDAKHWEPAERPAPSPCYAVVTMGLDEAWDGLPLSRQLHFAALAMEAARDAIPGAA